MSSRTSSQTTVREPSAPAGGGTRRRWRPLHRIADGAARAVRGLRNVVAEARSGQRPLVVVLLGAVVLSVVMLSGPAERYLDGRRRVEALRATSEVLDEEIGRLDARTRALQEPAAIEANARERLGMIRPGEVPFTISPPDVDRPRITAPRGSVEEAPEPWWMRAWDTVRSWF